MHILFIFPAVSASSQVVRGTVFDSSRRYPIESVTVMSTSGSGSYTDTLGKYQVSAGPNDSIWFSFQGKPTVKYPVRNMPDPLHFDIALTLKPEVMREVRIRIPYYKEDSVQNRLYYSKAFDYEKPTLKTATTISGGAVGIDINELARMFQVRKNRSMQALQKRLVEEEQRKFIDRRFNRPLVARLTELADEELDLFMEEYRPSYEFCLVTREYEFQLYIKNSGEKFRNSRKP